jgi:TP901 family phage tail tape measure protein
MSGNYTEYTTRIFLNDSEAENKLKKLREEVVSLKAEKEKALSDQNMTAFNKAEKDIRKCEKEMKALATTSQSVDKVLSNLSTASVDDIERTIRALNRELRSGAVERNSKEWRFLNEQLKRAKTELNVIQDESKESSGKGIFGRMVESLNKNWGSITQIIGGITQLTMTIRQTTQSYADMEESMANVTKYTGQTSEQIHSMNEEFKKIDTRTSREQLNDLAGAAGRLGIQSHDEIMEFVDAADKINVALGDDLGADAVATIGKLAMAFGEDDKMGLRGAMLATGSAVNEMAQNSSASASYLVDFAARLSGIGQQAGMTQAQLIGLGSVMDENMQRDEMASTAISTIISKLATDSDKFAKVAGLNAVKFKKLVATDMNGALLTLFDTLGKKGGLTKLAPMFGDMGLDGARAVGVLTVLANKVNDVRKNQLLATQAYKQGTSVISEFNTQNNTVQAGIDKCKKEFNDLSVELGEKLTPIVKYTITSGSLLIKALSALAGFVTTFRTTIIAVTATLVLLNIQKLYHITLTKLQILWDNYLKKSLISLWTLIKTNPYSAMTIAIVAVAAAIFDLTRKSNELTQSQKSLKKIEDEATSSIAEQQLKVEMLTKRIHDNKLSLDERKTAIQALQSIIPDYNVKLTQEGKLYDENTQSLAAYNAQLKKKALLEGAKSELAELGKKRAQLIRDRAESQRALKQLQDQQKKDIQTNANHPQTSQGNVAPSTVYALSGSSASILAQKHAIDNLNSSIKETETAINDVTDAYGGMIATEQASSSRSGITGNGGNSGNYKSEAQLKKEETERKKREAAALKEKREADKAEKALLNTQLAELTTQYSQGLITYSEYIKKREEYQISSIERRKSIWGKGTTEANQLADDEVRAREKFNDEMQKLREDDIENARVAQAAYIKAQYYDKNSSIYMNEDALNEALYENDMSALADRIAAETEGSENWLQLKAEMEQRELDHQVQQQDDYQQKLTKFREEWGKKDVNEQEKIALNGLEDLHTKGLISEKEYQEMLLQIKRHYAAEQAAADAEDKGPGSNTRKFNEDTTTVLNKAKAAAGDVSNPGSDNAMDSLFTNDFTNWKNVNEQIKIMEQTGVASHAQANAAKAQNDNEYLETLQNRTQLVYNSINTIMSAASAYSQACSDLEVARITSNYNKQIQAAGKNSKKKEKLEKERDKKIAEAKTKANKKAMGMEIAQAIAQTAMGAISAYSSTMAGAPYPSNLVLAPISAGIALAAGALQIATIQKSHQAEQMGYEEGGFTGGYRYKKQAGIVHEGEFVANHNAVNNPSILPALQLIDLAQRNNTVSSLTGDDVSRAVGNGNAALVAPIVNVQTNSQEQQEMRITIERLSETVDGLQKQLSDGIYAYATIDGEHGVKKQLDRYNRLISNK